MADRIAAIAQTVLSRPVLTSIITGYDLYQRDRQHLPMADVVETMRKDIKIGTVQDVTNARDRVPAFQIAFAYTDRYKAQKVVNDLVGKFVDTNLRERSSSSLYTTQLLKDQSDQAKRELDAIEGQLAEFRTRNQGRLPDELQANLQQLNALHTRVSNLNSSLSRVSQEKILLETQLRIARDQLAALTKDSGTIEAAKSERLGEVDREIHFYENQLANLREHYKEVHPDIQRASTMLSASKRKREQILKDENEVKQSETATPRPLSPLAAREARDLEASIRRVQGLIEAKDLESQEYGRELSRAENTIRGYQARLESVPLSQKEYSELIREREMAKTKYGELEVKVNRAMLAQDMENRKAGENLEPLDPPSLPETPTAPKRGVIIAIGTGVGLMLGIVFAGAREVKDTSLKNLKDVRAYTQLPILGSVPLLENDLIVKHRRRFAWFAWSLACLTGIAVMSGSIIYYFFAKQG
jgi:uncharacterized protein involved in exopolysaccharide biosynthesis